MLLLYIFNSIKSAGHLTGFMQEKLEQMYVYAVKEKQLRCFFSLITQGRNTYMSCKIIVVYSS